MPEPFAMPVIVTVTPSITICFEIALATMSVVMIASAALSQLSSTMSATAAGSPAAIFATGNGSMITPVENGNIWFVWQFSNPASAAQVLRASCKPCSPVPAFALPVFTTSARMPLFSARCSFATITGAAQKRFLVNTPAMRAPSHSPMTSKSLRCSRLIFASAMPSATPATGLAATGGFRLTGIQFPLL